VGKGRVEVGSEESVKSRGGVKMQLSLNLLTLGRLHRNTINGKVERGRTEEGFRKEKQQRKIIPPLNSTRVAATAVKKGRARAVLRKGWPELEKKD